MSSTSGAPATQASRASVDVNNASAAKDRRQSLLGRINYAYDNRYLFTTNLRYDGTSKFNRDRRFGRVTA